MTTEEKLKHFKAAALEEARQESTAAIEEHRRALEKLFQEHTIDKDRQAALEVKTETDRLKRENNITLSKERLEIKRDISRKQEELKETLFVEVQEKLADYMATQEYQQLLISQIREIMKFAGNEEVTIYIDPELSPLKQPHRCCQPSADGFRVFLQRRHPGSYPGRHILIDNSFAAKFDAAKKNFTFDGGVLHE